MSELWLFLYKIQVVQKLEPQDFNSQVKIRNSVLLEQMRFSFVAEAKPIGIIPACRGLPFPCKSTSMNKIRLS